MLRFILGKSGSGKTRAVYDRIKEDIKSGRDGIIILIPDQISLETEKAMLQTLGSFDAQRVGVFGFNKLCRYIFENTRKPDGELMDDGIRSAVMSCAIDDIGGSLRLLRSKSSRSLTSLMLGTMQDCKKNRISAEMLRGASQNPELGDSRLRDKLLDAADILDTFQGMLSGTRVDPLDSIDIAYRNLLDDPALFASHTVYIDGYSGFTAQQLRLVEQLIIRCPEVTVSLTLDPDRSDGSCREDVFAVSADTFRELKSIARKNSVEIKAPVRLSESPRFKNGELRALEASLYRDPPGEINYPGEPENILLYAAADPYEECERVACEISRLLRSGFRLRDIAVIANDTSAYSGIIGTALNKFGVPYFLDERRDIDVKPLARLVNSVFRCVLDRFEREDVLLLVKSGLLNFTEHEISDFEEYIYVWNIDNSGFLKPFTRSSSGFSDKPNGSDARLKNAEGVRSAAIAPLVEFRGAIKDKTVAEITRSLYSLLTDSYSVGKGIHSLKNKLIENGSHELAAEQVRIWNLFAGSLDKLVLALGGRRVTPKRYYELLSMQLECMEFAEVPRYIDSVIVTNAQRVRDPHYRAVFLIGCTEGSFPADPKPSGLFSEYELRALQARAFRLTDSAADASRLEIFIAYNCLTAASELLYVSYPMLSLSVSSEESAGTALKPSSIVAELKVCFPKLKTLTADDFDRYRDGMANMNTAFEAYALSLSDPCADLSGLREVFESDPVYSRRLDAVERALSCEPFELKNPANADALFGRVFESSPSSIDRFYNCPFNFFCGRGLRIQKPQKAEISGSERGTLIHKILQRFFEEYPTKALYGALSDSEIADFVRREFEAYINQVMGGHEDKTGSFEFQFNSLLEKTVKVIRCVADELRESGFEVRDTELEFPRDIPGYEYTLPDGHVIRVNGKVDRVDIAGEGGKSYFRIVDYKTSREDKKIELYKAYYGLDLQMLIYTIAILRNGGTRYSEPVPASAVYSRAMFNAFSQKDTGQPDELIREALQFRGIYLDGKSFARYSKTKVKPVTADQLGLIFSRVDEVIRGMGERIYSGKIPAVPRKGGYRVSLDSCENCDYSEVCSYNKQPEEILERLSDKEVFEKIEGGQADE